MSQFPFYGFVAGGNRSTGPADVGAIMGGALSHFFQSGHALLSSSHNRNVSEQTRRNVRIVFDALCANPKVTVQRLDGLLSAIPRLVVCVMIIFLLTVNVHGNRILQ